MVGGSQEMSRGSFGDWFLMTLMTFWFILYAVYVFVGLLLPFSWLVVVS